jgi:hypothetical protein
MASTFADLTKPITSVAAMKPVDFEKMPFVKTKQNMHLKSNR